jgi:diguanylate cyclase (GGDEF)-like protein
MNTKETCPPNLESLQPAQTSNAYNQPVYFDWSLVRRYNELNTPFTVFALDLQGLRTMDAHLSQVDGDEALRWVAMVLAEESGIPVYRVGSDEFVILFDGENQDDHIEFAQSLIERLNIESKRFKLKSPTVTAVMINYRNGTGSSNGNIIGDVYAALDEVKEDPSDEIKVFDEIEIRTVRDFHWIVRSLATQMEFLTAQLDEMHHLAHTDLLTGLPNHRAAVIQLEISLERSKVRGESLSILLIDGDNLKRYNDISYSTGDEMIQKLGTTQQNHLRTRDFLARWRMGDEFLLIMPGTAVDGALKVAERVRSAVERESQTWPLPVTISAGLAVYPTHGKSMSDLLYQAEKAKNSAKALGKNQISTAQ